MYKSRIAGFDKHHDVSVTKSSAVELFQKYSENNEYLKDGSWYISSHKECGV